MCLHACAARSLTGSYADTIKERQVVRLPRHWRAQRSTTTAARSTPRAPQRNTVHHSQANHPDCPVGSQLACEAYANQPAVNLRHTVDDCVYQLATRSTRRWTTAPTLTTGTACVIGPRDFAQVYAGDVDGVAPDDIVAVYEDGAVEVFLTKYAPDNPLLATSRGVGFHSLGVVLGAGVATVTTVNFLGTLHGYGTTCRSKDFGCTSPERAVFVGTWTRTTTSG